MQLCGKMHTSIERKITTFLSYTQHFLKRYAGSEPLYAQTHTAHLSPPGKRRGWEVDNIGLVHLEGERQTQTSPVQGSPVGAIPCPLTLAHAQPDPRQCPWVRSSTAPWPTREHLPTKGFPWTFQMTTWPPSHGSPSKGSPLTFLENIEASTSRVHQNLMEVHLCHHHRGRFSFEDD